MKDEHKMQEEPVADEQERVENKTEEITDKQENSKSEKSKQRIRLIITLIASAITLLFFGLSFHYFSTMVAAVLFVVIIAIVSVAIAAIFKKWETVYKLSITALYIAAVCLIVFFALSKTELFSSINSADDVVAYINNSGGVAEVIFVLANFLQVTIIPIPSTITTTAGAILFEGIWKPLYLTVIGLVIGSMLAFFLGKVFGVRFANWLVGEKTINKYREMTKGRDKIVLFYMFIFPFFPDDFLCILAGMTNYTYIGFFFLQVVSRTLGTFVTILLTKGIISIPLDGWWLALWGVIIILVIFLLIMTIKYSEKIERVVMNFIDKLTFGLTKRHRAKKEKTIAIDQAKQEELSAEESGIAPPAEKVQEGEKNDDPS